MTPSDRARAANGALWAAGYHLLELVGAQQAALIAYTNARTAGDHGEIDRTLDVYLAANTARTAQIRTVTVLAGQLSDAENSAINHAAIPSGTAVAA